MIKEITLDWECRCGWCGVDLYPEEGALEVEDGDGSVYCSYECALAADRFPGASGKEGA